MQSSTSRFHWLRRWVFVPTAAMAAFVWLSQITLVQAAPPRSESLLQVDYRAVVSQADLIYLRPAPAAVQGQPIGNGKMGTMVWTTPGGVEMQINRNDVFAVNKHHAGGAFAGATDYCGACCRVSVDVGGQPFRAGPAFSQRLSLYDAQSTVAGEEVSARCFVSADSDVLSLEIDDRREQPQPLRITVSMWRPPLATTGAHRAEYRFSLEQDQVLLVRNFDEQDYHSGAAVAVQLAGGGGRAQRVDERTCLITAPALRGKRTIHIASAASWSREENIVTTASRLARQAAARSHHDLQVEHARWWSSFWSRTFVALSSDDDADGGVADFVGRLRNLHLYYMASSSRGALPPKWNGSIFSVDGDKRNWGAQFWVWTTEASYFPLYAADAIDLTDPFFNMYVKQLPDARRASQQRWGAKGAFFPETTPFDGPLVLPAEAGREFRDFFLQATPDAAISELTAKLSKYECSLAVVASRTNPAGAYTWISHMASSGAELAVQAWWRYRYTGDDRWLRSHAYPLLRGAAEFYRTMLRTEPDGLRHIYGTNQHEAFWGVNDGQVDLAAIRGVAPLAIRAAQILEVDPELRGQWRQMLEELVPYTLGSDPESRAILGGVLAEDLWSVGHLGKVNGIHNHAATALGWPVFPFEDWTLETKNANTDRIVQAIADLEPGRRDVLAGARLATAIRTPILEARLGRGEHLPQILASYYQKAFAPLPNGWSEFEGPTAHSIEHLGCLSMALQEALLQSVSARPGGVEIIRLLPAWPKEWNADFRLLARGGFLVGGAVHDGRLSFVEIESRRGEACRLRNPWRQPVLLDDGQNTRLLKGDLLRFPTTTGGRYRLFPQSGPPPRARRIAPATTTAPATLKITLPGGQLVEATLGIGR